MLFASWPLQVAFSVGGRFVPGNAFSIVGAHTDSPCLKLKPVFTRTGAGFHTIGVECYGGGLWHTWFDRDLSVAGRGACSCVGGSWLPQMLLWWDLRCAPVLPMSPCVTGLVCH